eukprot:5779154-Prymnesium_polylepis.1
MGGLEPILKNLKLCYTSLQESGAAAPESARISHERAPWVALGVHAIRVALNGLLLLCRARSRGCMRACPERYFLVPNATRARALSVITVYARVTWRGGSVGHDAEIFVSRD